MIVETSEAIKEIGQRISLPLDGFIRRDLVVYQGLHPNFSIPDSNSYGKISSSFFTKLWLP